MSTIGERIRKRRKELGMSVDDLAERLGKNRTTIYRYESDDIENMPISVIRPLAEILKVSPAYIMGWGYKESDSEETDEYRPTFHWSDNFRENLSTLLSCYDSADMEAACVDEGFMNDVADGDVVITLDIACDVADQMGESLDEMVGRESFSWNATTPYDDLISIYSTLSESQQKEVMNFAEYLAQKNE